jgi:hypothetical protein
VKKKVSRSQSNASSTSVIVTEVDYEDPDEDEPVVQRIRSKLSALEVPDDEEDLEFSNDVDEAHQAILDAEVAMMNSDTVLVLGEMSSSQRQEAMFMLSKVLSFVF